MRDETRFKLFVGALFTCSIVFAVYCWSFLASIVGMFVFGLLFFSVEGLIRLWRDRKKSSQVFWVLRGLSGFLVVFGAFSFFVPFVAVVGGLPFLGNGFEWPAGYSNNVVIDPEGNHIVAIPWMGRIQIYDAERRFVRGWWVPGGGDSDVKLRLLERGNIQVWQSKQNRGFAFARDGKLLWQLKITPDEFKNAQATPYRSTSFATRWYCWPLVHPICGWLTAVVGGIGGGLLAKLERRSKGNKPRP